MAIQIALIVALILVHLFGIHLLKLTDKVRSAFLSFAGGTAIAYVFLHLLPELAEVHEELSEMWAPYGLDEIAGYMGAVVGLVFFYGMDRLVSRAKKASPDEDTPKAAFWLHVSSFALYNFVIGHLLAEYHEEAGVAVWMFFIAMAFHFVTNDIGLYREHKGLYARAGRWLVIASLMLGWIRGHMSELNDAAFASLFAFVAGGMVMNVLKEELPEAAESKFFMFALGVVGYGFLLHMT